MTFSINNLSQALYLIDCIKRGMALPRALPAGQFPPVAGVVSIAGFGQGASTQDIYSASLQVGAWFACELALSWPCVEDVWPELLLLLTAPHALGSSIRVRAWARVHMRSAAAPAWPCLRRTRYRITHVSPKPPTSRCRPCRRAIYTRQAQLRRCSSSQWCPLSGVLRYSKSRIDERESGGGGLLMQHRLVAGA